MIARFWHGYTTPENADKYEKLLKEEIFPSIEQKRVEGYRSIQLFRRPAKEEVEFITIMFFDHFKAVKDFAGDEYEKSYVPEKARRILSRHDESSQHYELRQVIEYINS
jgi:hypothetical protein